MAPNFSSCSGTLIILLLVPPKGLVSLNIVFLACKTSYVIVNYGAEAYNDTKIIFGTEAYNDTKIIFGIEFERCTKKICTKYCFQSC